MAALRQIVNFYTSFNPALFYCLALFPGAGKKSEKSAWYQLKFIFCCDPIRAFGYNCKATTMMLAVLSVHNANKVRDKGNNRDMGPPTGDI